DLSDIHENGVHHLYSVSKPRSGPQWSREASSHGASKDGSFTITDNRMESKTINFQNTILDEVKNPARFINTDFLFIFDCCFAHYATRAPETTRNIIEILAATSSETVEARGAADNTFTAKLANEIARRQRANHDSVDFASVFQSIRARSTVRVTPTHALLVGAASVTLPLNGHKLVDPQAIPADYTALFSVNVSRDVTAQDMKELVAWMRGLPPFAGLKIESVYRTQSTCFILHAALSVYAKLHSMQGYTLIAENPGPRLNHLLQLEPSEEPTQSHIERERERERERRRRQYSILSTMEDLCFLRKCQLEASKEYTKNETKLFEQSYKSFPFSLASELTEEFRPSGSRYPDPSYIGLPVNLRHNDSCLLMHRFYILFYRAHKRKDKIKGEVAWPYNSTQNAGISKRAAADAERHPAGLAYRAYPISVV
ncbi:uncharacterized protein An08g09930, partial [Aspergillus niger]